MKKIVLAMGAFFVSSSVWAMTPAMYYRVMSSVQTRNLKMLQNLVAGGVNLNSPLPNGMTPLCETVARGDYEGYEMLQTQGASPYVPCIRRLPPQQVSNFYANQPPAHTYYKGQMMAAKPANAWNEPLVKEYAFPYLSVGEFLLGGVAAGAMLALGHGHSSSGGGGNTYKWDTPMNLNPSTFETPEYQAQPDSWPGSVDFLQTINASSAYARGYSGYKVNREKDGTLKKITNESQKAYEDNDYVTNTKVKVAVVDEGVWTGQKVDGVWNGHPDLAANIGATYNFVYGVCSANNSEKCWDWSDGQVTLYENWSTEKKVITSAPLSEARWLAYQQKYAGYVYNDKNANPIVYQHWYSETTGRGYDRYYKDVQTGTGDETTRYWYMLVDGTEVPCGTGETVDSCTYQSVTYIAQLNYMNHGTHVAGLVGATKNNEGMMGVAYNAEIIPVKHDLDIGTGQSPSYTTAVAAADIVNISLGPADDAATHYSQSDAIAKFKEKFVTQGLNPDLYQAFQNAATSNKIMVFAAGNYDTYVDPTDNTKKSYFYDPTYYNYAPLYFDQQGTYNLKNLMVTVVSLNENKSGLALYSAECGPAMSYCVGAPGGAGTSYIYSTVYSGGGYTYGGMQGTSMAAPIVSGALAVIKGAFPHLTNQQVVQILFETADYIPATQEQKDAATNAGATYAEGADEMGKYNSIFGRGAINLNAATDPIGLPKIVLTTSTTGSSVNANNSSSTVSSVLSNVATALPQQMIVLDKYQRAFAVPTASFVRVAKRENKLEGRFKSFMSGDEKVVAKTDTLRMAYSERHSKLSSQMSTGSVSFELKPTAKWSFKTFYSENTTTSGGTYFERLLSSPYGKMKEAWGGAVDYRLTPNWQIGVQGQVGQNGFVDEKDLSHMDHNRMSLFQSSVKYTGLKKVGFKAVAGVANEQGSLFGMWGRGAFKTGNSKTSYIGAGVTLNLTDVITLEGMYYVGSTKVSQANSLVQMSNVKSDSFALTASWQMDDARTIGLSFASPLRVRQGTARVTLPVARDAYQDIVYQQKTNADLSPSAREYDLGLYYTDALREDVLLKSEFGVRLNPDHVAGSAPDWRALIGMHWGL